MEEFGAVKDERSRHHPEDVSSDEHSDNEGKDSFDLDRLDISDDEFFEIPGTGDNDKSMPLFKGTSRLTGSYNTGVKGVIADATSYESAKRMKSRARSESTYASGYVPMEADSTRPLRPSRSEGESDEEEEEFVRTWRKNRMDELRGGRTTVRRQSPSKRKYGRVEQVDASGYLDAVEKISSETIVVVTIYNDESEESKFVEDCLNTLARRYVTTRWIKLHYLEAEMDSAAVPAVLAYKGGELFANIMRIVDEIPSGRSLSAESLELVLRKANVLHKDASI